MANILLTNDDGIGALGIQYLKTELIKRGHNVLIIAPHEDKSGSSFKLTLSGYKLGSIYELYSIPLSGTVEYEEVEPYVFRIKGTPVDCVIVGMEVISKKVDFPIDIVVSGINDSENRDLITLFSGTCAAAYFAYLQYDKLSFSFSARKFGSDEVLDYESMSKMASDYIDYILGTNLKSGYFNVNVPSVKPEEVEKIVYVPFVSRVNFICEDNPYEGASMSGSVKTGFMYLTDDNTGKVIIVTVLTNDLTDYSTVSFIKNYEESRR